MALQLLYWVLKAMCENQYIACNMMQCNACVCNGVPFTIFITCVCTHMHACTCVKTIHGRKRKYGEQC